MSHYFLDIQYFKYQSEIEHTATRIRDVNSVSMIFFNLEFEPGRMYMVPHLGRVSAGARDNCHSCRRYFSVLR